MAEQEKPTGFWPKLRGFFTSSDRKTARETSARRESRPVASADESRQIAEAPSARTTLPTEARSAVRLERTASDNELCAQFDERVLLSDAFVMEEALRILLSPAHPRLALRVAEVLIERGELARARSLAESLPNEWANGLVVQARLATDERAAMRFWERVLVREYHHAEARSALSARDRVNDAGATLPLVSDLDDARYRITRQIGAGGAGRVYAALDVRTSRSVAVKVYHRKQADELLRLESEVSIPAELRGSAGVVRILDVDRTRGMLVTELLEGPLSRLPSVNEQERRRIVRSAIGAVRDVHSGGFAHRDLKPSNVLLTREHTCVLIDFGLALPLGAPPERSHRGGSPGFAAPEQLAGAAAATASDIYSLARLIELVLRDFLDPDQIRVLAAAASDVASARPSLSDLTAVFGADA